MADVSIIFPLYPREDPYHPGGWMCCYMAGQPPRMCGRVVRTRRGVLAHLWLVHKIKRQGELFNEHNGSPATTAGQ